MPFRGVLLDIEGTTSSISFVYDRMFPYVREHVDSFVDCHWNDNDVRSAVELIRAEAGYETLSPDATVQEVIRLMDADKKSTGLKQLQGIIWRSGFESGELVAHVYDDVPVALQRWKERGVDIRIYSSGSVEAQKLFFGNSIAGNLLPFFTSHYDTTIGSKKEATSYSYIAKDFGLPESEILFVSDVMAELEAATAIGMQTRLSLRPGNPVQEANAYLAITSFAEIE